MPYKELIPQWIENEAKEQREKLRDTQLQYERYNKVKSFHILLEFRKEIVAICDKYSAK